MRLLVIGFICFVQLVSFVSAGDLTYPNGAKKAVIFSYDDGVVQDQKLVEIFDRYQVVGTFNLNSGLLGKPLPWMSDFIGKPGKCLTREHVKTVYEGHEIAGHSFSHPGLAGLEAKELQRQIELDQQILSAVKGETLRSFAYPLGSYDLAAIRVLRELGFTNARTVEDTHNFDLPTDFMTWHPTVHHTSAMPLIDAYLQLVPEKLTVMMIWGHSWEFDQNERNNSWNYAEKMIQKVSGRDDIWYVSAGDFVRFIQDKPLK